MRAGQLGECGSTLCSPLAQPLQLPGLSPPQLCPAQLSALPTPPGQTARPRATAPTRSPGSAYSDLTFLSLLSLEGTSGGDISVPPSLALGHRLLQDSSRGQRGQRELGREARTPEESPCAAPTPGGAEQSPRGEPPGSSRACAHAHTCNRHGHTCVHVTPDMHTCAHIRVHVGRDRACTHKSLGSP